MNRIGYKKSQHLDSLEKFIIRIKREKLALAACDAKLADDVTMLAEKTSEYESLKSQIETRIAAIRIAMANIETAVKADGDYIQDEIDEITTAVAQET